MLATQTTKYMKKVWIIILAKIEENFEEINSQNSNAFHCNARYKLYIHTSADTNVDEKIFWHASGVSYLMLSLYVSYGYNRVDVLRQGNLFL